MPSSCFHKVFQCPWANKTAKYQGSRIQNVRFPLWLIRFSSVRESMNLQSVKVAVCQMLSAPYVHKVFSVREPKHITECEGDCIQIVRLPHVL